MNRTPTARLGVSAVSWLLIGTAPAWAATYTVSNTNDSGAGSLRAAISSAGNGDTITFASSLSGQTVTLASDLPAIQNSITINGNGVTLSGNNAYRGLFVYSGTVAVNDLTIANATAKGGDGASVVIGAGGGGAGLGGALFVKDGAAVTVSNVAIINSQAIGGDGGDQTGAGPAGSGGGGGMGGNGAGSATGGYSGGGGGLGTGANGGTSTSAGSGGIATGQAGGASGGTTAGGADGGGGGGSGIFDGFAGGGGIGATGGDGGFGGGGGGLTNWPIAYNGGNGGFGGGGGGTNFAGSTTYAGAGGYGGGGGGGGSGSSGGFGGGDGGGSGQGGGGGAGMGGGIFVMQGGSLTLAGSLTVNGNSVAGGTAGTGGGNGAAYGAGMFFQGSGTVMLQPGAGQTQTVSDVLADEYGVAGGSGGKWGLTLDGPGTLILNSDSSTLSGSVTVQAGTLEVGDAAHSGAKLGGDVTVNAAGTLAGHGTVKGDVSNATGGIVSPGGSVGTLSVGGNYTQGSASTLRIEVSPSAASRLAVSGTASLDGTLNLVFTPGVYHQTSYTIVSSSGLTGTFNTVTENGGGIYGGITYNLNNVLLAVNNGSIGVGAVTVAPSNGQVIGATSVSMVQGAQASNRALFGHLSDRRGGGSSDDNLRTAFAGSNPNQVAFAGDLAGLNAVLASLPQELAQQGGWFRATGGFGSIDGSGGVPGVDSHGGGFMAGYDYQLTDHILLGAAVGYSRTQLEQDDGSSSEINTPRVTVYGSYQIDKFALDGSLGYGYDRIKTNNVSDGGVATSKHDAHEIVAGLQASYAVDLPQKVVVTPRVGLDYLHLFEEGFKESGAGGFDLTTESGDMDSLRPSVGVSVSRDFVTDGGTVLTPQLDLTYSREVLDNGRNAQVLVGGGAFTVAGVKPSRDQLTLGASLTASLTQSFDLFGGYTALLPVGNTISHNFEAGFRATF